MAEQPTITDQLVDQAARIVAHEHGSDVFDDDHVPNEYTDVQIDLYRSVAQLVLAAAAPHIAAQALQVAAGDLALSTYHHECAAAVQTRLKQLAEAALADSPGSAAPTRTEHVLVDLVDLASVLHWAAEEYRRHIAAARCSIESADYATRNGRAEAYRQLADRVAATGDLDSPDWDAIRSAVPADGIYR